MHLALNGWFWDRPDTGSGQYVRALVAHLPAVLPDLQISLIATSRQTLDDLPEGIAKHEAPARGGGHLAKVPFEQSDFPQTAARIGADVVHVPYWGSPLRCEIPVVVTVHDLIPLVLPAYRGGIMARLYTGLVGAAARGAAAVITDSTASAEDIVKHLHVDPQRLFPIPLAAGPEFVPGQERLIDLALRKKYKLPGEFVLYLGGYDVRKNLRRLLEAFTYVRTGYDIPLVLAGKLPSKDSPRFWDVPAMIEQYDLGDIVQVIGWVDEEDKPALYRMAKVFVFPSRYEGFGLPVLEAMACGTPVVAADATSIPEIVGDAAFLVEPNDTRHMAGSILALLVQEELNADMSQRGLTQAATFSWSRTAVETAKVYQHVLDDMG